MKILKYTKTFEECPNGCRGKLSYLHDDQEHKTCSCGTKWNRITNNLVVNNFIIEQCTNLPSRFMQWQARHLFSDLIYMGSNKKECISWAKKFNYENES